MTDAETPSKTLISFAATEQTAEEETTATEPHSHAMKPLQARHLFRFANILKKIGIDRFKSIFDSEAVVGAVKEGKSVEDVGMTVVFDALGVIIDNLPKIEGDVYGLLADLSGMTAEDVADLPLGEFTGMLVDVIKADGFKDFFTQAQRLLK